jgi:nicotinic acetylcholine receptor
MRDPFHTDFKITTREPSFVLHNPDDDSKMKAHSSSELFKRKWIAAIDAFVLVTGSSNITPRSLSANVLSALQGVRFIAQHIRDADKDNEVNCVLCRRYFSNSYLSHQFLLFFTPLPIHYYRNKNAYCWLQHCPFPFQIVEDWKFVSMVLDRFFLWVFTLACIGGTFGIICQAPSLYDTRVPVHQQLSEMPATKIIQLHPAQAHIPIL